MNGGGIGMRRTLKKSLAMFLSAALLFSNSMVTAADSGAAAETHAEDAGGEYLVN